MPAQSNCCQKGCQICQKQLEIAEMQASHKRDMSLQTIYRKDYFKNNTEKDMIALPHKRKNESSNIQGKPKSFFVLNSNYGLNYHPNNPQKPIIAHSKDSIITQKRDSLQTYKSTYQRNYLQHFNYHVEENYKIADPQFYNLKTPFKQLTEYKQHYKLITINKKQSKEFKNQQKSTQIRLFQTTQRHSYRTSNKIDANLPALPCNNMSTLPTTPSLFSTTYRNQFAPRNKDKDESKGRHNLSHFYNF